MKLKFKAIISGSAISALALAAVSQDMADPQSPATATEYQRMADARIELEREVLKASDLLGMRVENDQHEKLGKVNTLFLNLRSGRVVQVILAAKGTLTAVPPNVLRHEADGKALSLDVSMEKFAGAPRFNTAKCDDVTESNRVVAVYDYYGQESYFVSDSEGLWTTNANGSANTDGTRDESKSRNADIDRHVGDQSNTISTRNPDGSQSGEYYSNGNAAIGSFSSLGAVRDVKTLLGMTVRNYQQVKLGKVNNFIIDLAAGRVAAVIITSGGAFGSGGELSAAPVTALRYDRDHKDLQLDATREMLAESPNFNISEWPNFRLPGYSGGIYYPYKIAPYNNRTAPDMTAQTGEATRKEDNGSLPAIHQGTDQADADITAAIRQEIAGNQAMSANAKNITIITLDGRVTLRGPVANDGEKHDIGLIAARVAPSGTVDNELEVQMTTGN